jgi:hypothetical protein
MRRHQLELYAPFTKSLVERISSKEALWKDGGIGGDPPLYLGKWSRRNKGLSQDARAGRIQQPFRWR